MIRSVSVVLVAHLAAGCGLSQPGGSLEPSPQATLDAMDGRRPVPLQPMMALHQKQNMRDHLLVIQQIVEAVAREDWMGVESAATRFGSSPQMQMQCEHMGTGADGFAERALDFHSRADDIVVAARQHDTVAVLQATSSTLAACTDCHALYRQELVTEQQWTALAGAVTASPP